MKPKQRLEEHGLLVVGHVWISRQTEQRRLEFNIVFDVVPEAECWPYCVYAFRGEDGEVVRIGKAHCLRCRVSQWRRDITGALNRKSDEPDPKGGASRDEAADWKRFLHTGAKCEFLALCTVSETFAKSGLRGSELRKSVLRKREQGLINLFWPRFSRELRGRHRPEL